MEKPKILVGHHPAIPRGSAEVHEVDGVEVPGLIEITEEMKLVFITNSLPEDLFALGVIKMIVAKGKQALVIKNSEQEIPGL